MAHLRPLVRLPLTRTEQRPVQVTDAWATIASSPFWCRTPTTMNNHDRQGRSQRSVRMYGATIAAIPYGDIHGDPSAWGAPTGGTAYRTSPRAWAPPKGKIDPPPTMATYPKLNPCASHRHARERRRKRRPSFGSRSVWKGPFRRTAYLPQEGRSNERYSRPGTR